MANANDRASSRFAFTAPAILIYNEGLFKATQYLNKGEFKFNGTFVLAPDHPNLAALKAEINKVAQAASPGIAWNAFGKPISTGDKLADKRKAKKGDKYSGDAEWMRGQVVLQSRSKFAPALSIVADKRVIELKYDAALLAKYKAQFFFGAEVVVEVALVWYPAQKEGDRPGVTAYCQAVLATGKGTRLSGTRPAAETFTAYLGHATSEDPTGGAGIGDLDDEIPL